MAARTKKPTSRVLSVPELLTELAAAAGKSPGQKLAEQLGTSRAQVARLLSGETDPRWSTLERVGEALGAMEGRQLRIRLVVEQQPAE